MDSLPLRVLRFRLRLDRFSYSIQHVPGKNLYSADALSHAPTSTPTQSDSVLGELPKLAVESHVAHLPASSSTRKHRTQTLLSPS